MTATAAVLLPRAAAAAAAAAARRGAELRRGAPPMGHTVVEDLPTAFGNLDLELLEGHLRIEGRWREAPNRVVWHKPEGEKGTLVVNSRSKSSKKSRIEI